MPFLLTNPAISNSEPLVLPGVSTISKESKGVNYINLNLNKSKTKCNPEQTGFYIKFKKQIRIKWQNL